MRFLSDAELNQVSGGAGEGGSGGESGYWAYNGYGELVWVSNSTSQP
ncbi:hypothetical protein [Jeongeupia chitinilytica]|uniref:Bacteriocin n=1 Tax=Jeongeupia chitinilytica TaxID=1041641 RepID=A0ABQ3H2J2_9NEIS|nr:hypothetical protein [Jeongeupia chitinilytica]GHD64289.1 hypothetical protein GCM10007350_23130 [Jeongeupia chitinilytica]